MKTTLTQSFKEASTICKPLSWLVIPPKIENELNSGKVLYFLNSDEGSLICWPYFPISKHRTIVKEINKLGFQVPKVVKVIIEIGMVNGDEKIEEFMLDCFGHTILYLLAPRARNECEDANELIDKLGIYYRIPS